MAKVFVDTAAWIAVLNKNDALHASTQRVMRSLQQKRVQLVTSTFVLIEVADGMAAPLWRKNAIGFFDGLKRLPDLEIIPPSQELYEAGLALYRKRPDKHWGLTDCTSFVIMTDQHIGEALTSDHHFEQAGFRRLL
jgi:predicted nucleic acid-binding protein